jgi:hypothetical protein
MNLGANKRSVLSAVRKPGSYDFPLPSMLTLCMAKILVEVLIKFFNFGRRVGDRQTIQVSLTWPFNPDKGFRFSVFPAAVNDISGSFATIGRRMVAPAIRK